MATRTQSQSSNRSSSSRGAFSWSDHAGPLIGAAVAGAALGFAANLGRKFVIQGLEAKAGNWDEMMIQDHDEIRQVFTTMLATDSSQTWKRSMLLMKLAHMLDKHSYEEETVIYPALRDSNNLHDADELDKEHGHVKTMIFDLKQMEADDPNWLDKIRALRDDVSRHMAMEEDQIFPKLRGEMDEERNSKITMMVNKAGFMMA